MSKRKFKNILIVLLRFIILVIFLYGIFSIYKLIKINKNNNIENKKQKVEELLISKVNKIYSFPIGEIPTIATVTNTEALKNSTFFTLAKLGDKVLIFKKGNRAVLYRPSINKIIETTSIKILTKN